MHTSVSCKTAKPIKMPFCRRETRVGTRNHVLELDEVQIPHKKRYLLGNTCLTVVTHVYLLPNNFRHLYFYGKKLGFLFANKQ